MGFLYLFAPDTPQKRMQMLLLNENVANFYYKCRKFFTTMRIDFALPLWYYSVLRYILCMLHRSVQCITLYIVHVASFCTVYHALSGLGSVYL